MSIEVSAEDAASFTLERHHLLERAPNTEVVQVIDDVMGLNAQGAMNYQLSLWNRVSGLDRSFLPKALFEERSLARTWLMRDTVHIIPSRRLPLFRAALRESLMREWNRWTVRTGTKKSPKAWEPLYGVVLEALHERNLTVNQIMEALGWSGKGAKSRLNRLVREMSLQGLLCHAASSGPWYHDTEHSFARVDRWLPEADPGPVSEEDARIELVRRYLKAYGPASVNDFAYWTGMRVGDARPIFESLVGEITDVEVDGQRRKLHILEEDESYLGAKNTIPHARLLPQFDALIMGHKDKTRFIDPGVKKRIFMPRADVSATILVDSWIGGVWRMRKRGRLWRVELEPFGEMPPEHMEMVEGEVDRLRAFTGFDVEHIWMEK